MTPAWSVGLVHVRGPASGHEVVKLGGSLLAMPAWPAWIAELVRTRAASRPVLVVVGGGAIVDGLRINDAAAPRPPSTTHALAIDLLATTARLVADALALPVVADLGDESAAVLDPPRWLAAAGRLARLPVGWEATSDSIAALVAAGTAGDLLLAKRIAPPPCPAGDRLAALADAGWVDAYFPTAAAEIRRIAWAAPGSVPIPGVGGAALDGGHAGGG